MRVYERQYVRVDYQQEVKLETAERITLVVRGENISVGGLGICCDQMTAQMIMPKGYQLNPAKPLHLGVEFEMEDNSLKATCSIQNSYRLAQDLFCFNLKFIRLEQQGQQQLENFIQQQRL
ncbi:PilZ domain-containing protein [Cycloclasticus sp.]|uniref:PilZ domain-containing protein n=1 Tax=Cycloclasticus sp. TaxID=2024830 RepID=UPI000C0C6E3D|nr:PilZ domain-containing protein [Cycloclasticus sp.]PHR47507.1 MAG: PilZ domain-containing protein [Cycloclasticus sp.]